MRLLTRYLGGGASLWLGCALLGALTALARDPQERLSRGAPLSQRQPVLVGAFTDAYPYSFVDEDGHVTGFTVDILDAVARAANLKIRRISGRSEMITRSFQAGDFDLLQHHGIAPGREAYAEFSVPFLDLQGGIFVKQGGPVHTVSDLTGRTFGTIGNSGTAAKLLREQHVRANLVSVETSEQLVRRIEAGELDAGFMSQLTAVTQAGRLGYHDIVMLGEPFEGYEIHQAFAVHPGDAELLARLNEGLAVIHRTGEYDRIYRKNFGQFGSYVLTASELELIASGVLAVGFIASLWGYLRQRKLRKELSVQTAMLAEQGALLQALYDNIPVAMTVVETAPSGARVLTMNQHACWLYSAGTAPRGEALDRLAVTEDVRRHLLEAITPDASGSPVVTREAKLATGKRLLEVTSIRLGTIGGSAAARICVLVEDVTEKVQRDAEIARSRKLRAVGELVGGIAHEFNNLLTPVLLKAGEIQMSRPDDAYLQEEMEVITQAVQRTAELTRRLLTFGRKVDHREQSVRLEALVASCFDLLKHTVDRRITWSSSVPPNLRTLHFNATDLNQIVLNLLLNARDALIERLSGRPEPGWTPTISVEASDLPAGAFEPSVRHPGKTLLGWQRLTVRDNGVGMAPDVVDRIFEPFFTTKDVGKGTGLGLATVWHLVSEGGGHVKVESAPDVGSAFDVYIPVWPVAEAPKAVAASTREARPARVLLVEDEQLVARSMTDILVRHGHSVRHLENGLDAWRHLEGSPGAYDLLVIDVNLPGMTGVDVVTRLRESRFAGRILMVSGRFSPSDMHALTRLGIDHCLTKPFNVSQFIEAVTESLEATRA